MLAYVHEVIMTFSFWLARGRVNTLLLLVCLPSVLVGFEQTADLEKPNNPLAAGSAEPA